MLIVLAFALVQARISVGYYTADSVFKGYSPNQIPFYALTHLNYAFASVSPNGTVAIGDQIAAEVYTVSNTTSEQCGISGNLGSLWKLRQEYPHLRVMLSIGGGSEGATAGFTTTNQQEPTRQEFVKSSIALLKRYGFDGLDVDYEFPYTEDDNNNYIQLLKELRDGLDQQEQADGKVYALSIASPGILSLVKAMNLKEISKVIDWMSVMSYDMGGTLPFTYHDSPLYQSTEFPFGDRVDGDNKPLVGDNGARNVQEVIDQYLKQGVPSNKVILGLPLYGYSYQQVQVPSEANDPNAQVLLQSFNGSTTSSDKSSKAISWNEIMIKLTSGSPYDWVHFRDESAKSSYAWNPYTFEVLVFMDSSSAPWLVPVNGKTSQTTDLEEKLNFLVDRRLGGAMFWQLQQDAALPTQSILYQTAARLFPRNENQKLEFPVCAPQSELCNIQSKCSGSFKGADDTSNGFKMSLSLPLVVVMLVIQMV